MDLTAEVAAAHAAISAMNEAATAQYGVLERAQDQTLAALQAQTIALGELQEDFEKLAADYDALLVKCPQRDPLLWPYPTSSLWNMPIGGSATLQALGFKYLGDTSSQNSRVTIAEENILFLDPDAPLAYIKETDAAWNSAKTRCGSRTGRNLTGNGSAPVRTLPIPKGWSTEPYIGTTPNMSGAVVYREGTDLRLYETQPLHMCADGVAVSQYVNNSWVGDSIITGGNGIKGGSHGGSYLTAFGGTIRLGELVPGGRIPHALKVTLDTAWYCSAFGGAGHRWPALRADVGWATTYGTKNPLVPQSAKMGMLLTLPAQFDVDAMISEPARILARAVRDYGAYLCDGDANASIPHYTAWHVERSDHGSFTAEFKAKWGFEFFHQVSKHGTPPPAQLTFRAEVGRMMESICVVADNGPSNIGGAGPRRAMLAPAL